MEEKEEEKEKPKEKVEEKGYELVNVPTQHSLAVQTPDEKIISTEELIVLIANKLTKIESMLG